MPRTVRKIPVENPVEQRVERTLFPYQLETVELMETAEQTQLITCHITGFSYPISSGLLENQLGSGKTATVLKVIKNHKRPFEKMDKVTWYDGRGTPSTGNPQILFPDPTTGNTLLPIQDEEAVYPILYPIPTTLIVCSKTIVNHWKREAEHMLLDCLTIDAPKQVTEEELIPRLCAFQETVDEKGSAIVVSSHLFRRFIGILSLTKRRAFGMGYRCRSSLFFHRAVFDDIHSVTGWTSPDFSYSAGFLWFVNSTFGHISLSRREYISFRTQLFPEYLTAEGFIRVKVTVPQTTYTPPPLVETRVYYRDRTITRRLETHIPDNVREMLQTGDLMGAYATMAGLQTDDNGQLMIPVSARVPVHVLLENRYNRELEDLDRRKGRLTELGHSTEGVDQRITEVRSRLGVFRERIREICSETAECPICMDETDRQHRAVVKCCNNVFCKSCIGTSIIRNGTCPLCRERLGMDCLYSMDEEGKVIDLDYRTFPTTASTGAGERPPSTPMEALRNIIQTKPEGRFLVFAPTETSSATYRTFFRGSDITFADMGGSAVSIRKRLESFESGGLRVLFMSARTSNAGLNLQNATDVVILGREGGMIDQAIGRVRRFPRTEPVPVHYILRG